jgi:predicted TIM-barrel enzyme
MENLYTGSQTSKLLDPRGVFIIQSKDEIRVWIGASVPQANLEEYRKCADSFIELLQKYERGS